MLGRFWLSLAGLPIICATQALAAQKLVVFPFDMVLQQQTEDFYFGQQKPTPEEEKRLKLVYDELTKHIVSDGRYELVDIAALKGDIEAKAPIYTCRGCEVDLARKAGGELAITGIIDKASDTLLNLNIGLVDVAKGEPIRSMTVTIQGNTDEAWVRGVRWLAKNRLFAESTTR